MATTTTVQVSAAAVEADRLLTPHVVVGQLGFAGTCQAWMEAAERMCRKATDGHLCARHRTVAGKRRAVRLAEIEADQSKRKARVAAERDQARAELPENRRQLERVEARLAVLTAPPVDDRAAIGGQVHPSIARRAAAAFSSARVAEVRKLNAKAEALRKLVTLGEHA